MIIDVSVDDKAWGEALDRLIALSKIAGFEGSVSGAEAIRDRTRGALSMSFHGAGTRTPSPPGTPPSLISGGLMDSVLVDPDAGSEIVTVGPTARQARIQELGGGMSGHPWMHWIGAGGYGSASSDEGQEHYAKYLTLPPRPYFRPSSDSVIDSGELTEIYYQHWLKAQIEAVG